MADIHVLAGDGLGLWTIVLHFAVPNQDNNVSVNYRTALINSGLGGTSSMVEGDGPDEITTAELAAVTAGELFEYIEAFLAESGATNNAEMLAAAQAMYAARETPVLNKLKRMLRYYGYTGSAA
jgi:hypothetical protein